VPQLLHEILRRHALALAARTHLELDPDNSAIITSDEHALLAKAIVRIAAAFLRDGGVIAGLRRRTRRAAPARQQHRAIPARSRTTRARAQRSSSLKLGFNRVQGFFIEVNRSQADRVPPIICAARR
jgi:DNA mismatch repair ATPase MutS